MSGIPWLRLDEDGAVIEKIDAYEASGGAGGTPPLSASPEPAGIDRPDADALASLETLLLRLDETDDVAALIDGWQQARTIADAAQTAVWHLAGRIGDALGSRNDRARRLLPDGRIVEFTPNERRSWDRDRQAAALRALQDAAMRVDRKVDPETGEVESPVDVICRVLNDAARIEWKATVLKLYGLDPDSYSDLKAGRPYIRVSEP